MTSTSQDPDPKDTGSEPEEAPKDQKQEPKMVPLDEHVALRQKFGKAQSELDELKARMAKLENDPGSAETKPDPQLSDLVEKVEGLTRQQHLQDIGNQLGLVNDDQASAIAEFLGKNPDLTAEEALQTLSKRDPEKFEGIGQADTAQQAQFGSLSPRPGSQPEPQESDFEQRLKFTEGLAKQDKRQHRKYADNMVGSFLAKAMGWEHQKLPIPKQ